MANESNKNTSQSKTPDTAPSTPRTGESSASPSTGETSTSGTPAPNVGTGGSPATGGSATTGAARTGTAAGAAATGATTAGAATGSSSTGSTATSPRPATQTTGAGNPSVDTLSYEPQQEDWMAKAREWVEDNPALAVLGAVGIGLVVGRLIAAAIPEPEPKTLGGKIEQRAKLLAKEGRYYAEDAGDVIAEQLSVAADALAEASKAVAKGAKHGYKEAKDFSEHVAEAIGKAFSKKATEWLEKLS